MYILLLQISVSSFLPLIRDDFFLNNPPNSPFFFCEFLFRELAVSGALDRCAVLGVVVREVVFDAGASLSAAALVSGTGELTPLIDEISSLIMLFGTAF
mmetsp:Transcript_444/g.641  ORF Transcript_444/g.641 Transcript_444/m.641 type:complete len:99 (+) Transcript_444:66-362(+)